MLKREQQRALSGPRNWKVPVSGSRKEEAAEEGGERELAGLCRQEAA